MAESEVLPKKVKSKKNKKKKSKKNTTETDEDDDGNPFIFNPGSVKEVEPNILEEDGNDDDVEIPVQIEKGDEDDDEQPEMVQQAEPEPIEKEEPKPDEKEKPEKEEGDDTGVSKRKRKRKRKSAADTDKSAAGTDKSQADTNKSAADTKKSATEPQDDSQEEVSSSLPFVNKVVNDTTETTAYIQGIPFDATPEDVRRLFLDNGIAAEEILDLRLPTWNDTGRLKGYGHVAFPSEDRLDAAIQNCNNKYIGKRYVEVTRAANRKDAKSTRQQPAGPPPPDCKTIFCHNLPYSADEEGISKIFSKFGTVSDVRIARHSGTKKPKGFGYVTMETAAAVTAIVQGQTITMDGRTLRLDYDTGVIKGSFRTSTGELWSKKRKEDRKR